MTFPYTQTSSARTFARMSDDPEERARQRAEKRKARREAAANKAREEVAAFKQSLASEPEVSLVLS